MTDGLFEMFRSMKESANVIKDIEYRARMAQADQDATEQIYYEYMYN